MRKARAALKATALDDTLTGFRRHSLHKSVYSRSVAFFWLKSSFWHNVILVPLLYHLSQTLSKTDIRQ